MRLPDRIALDTNCFIYLFERSSGDARAELLRNEVLVPATEGRAQLVASTLALAELLVGPHRAGRVDEARRLGRALEQVPGLRLVPMTTSIAARAAELRAGGAFTLADAIHLATAEYEDAAFLTNDRRIRADSVQVELLLLDELVA